MWERKKSFSPCSGLAGLVWPCRGWVRRTENSSSMTFIVLFIVLLYSRARCLAQLSINTARTSGLTQTQTIYTLFDTTLPTRCTSLQAWEGNKFNLFFHLGKNPLCQLERFSDLATSQDNHRSRTPVKPKTTLSETMAMLLRLCRWEPTSCRGDKTD